MQRPTKGHRVAAAHQSRRAAWQIAAALLWTFTTGQALVVVHGYTHPTPQATAGCGVCLLGARVAQVSDPPPAPAEPSGLCFRLATVAHVPTAFPVQQTGGARAPPRSPFTSAAA